MGLQGRKLCASARARRSAVYVIESFQYSILHLTPKPKRYIPDLAKADLRFASIVVTCLLFLVFAKRKTRRV